MAVDLRRLRAGEWIAAGCGVLLAVSLFLPWYRRDAAPGGEGGRDFSAWQAFSLLDVALLVLAALAVALLVATALAPAAAVGVAADALLTILAGVVVIATALRVLDLPDSLELAGADLARAPFAWLGLAAEVGVVVGTTVAMRDERLSGLGGQTDATGAPMAAAPEIPTIPAPPRAPAAE